MAVVAAAERLPNLRATADRIGRTGGGSQDWSMIAEADPYGSWPSIQVLAQSARTKLDLVVAHEMARVGDITHVAWSLNRARVTWRDGCLAVGTSPTRSTAMHRYVDDLGACRFGAALSWFDSPVPSHLAATVGVVVDRHPYTNYYHWLLGALRAAILLEDSGVLATMDRLIICMPRSGAAFIDESLDALGLDRSVVDVCSSPFDLSFDTVIVPTPAHLQLAIPVDDYARRLRQRLGLEHPPQAGRRRLLISRRDAASRRVTNEHDLAIALAALDFEVVVPGQLSFVEQAEAFASAEFIVAPHGAALASLVFCSPRTCVVEFRDEHLSRPFFERLAVTVGLTYRTIPCRADPASPQDLVVDPQAASRLIEALLQHHGS